MVVPVIVIVAMAVVMPMVMSGAVIVVMPMVVSMLMTVFVPVFLVLVAGQPDTLALQNRWEPSLPRAGGAPSGQGCS